MDTRNLIHQTTSPRAPAPVDNNFSHETTTDPTQATTPDTQPQEGLFTVVSVRPQKARKPFEDKAKPVIDPVSGLPTKEQARNPLAIEEKTLKRILKL